MKRLTAALLLLAAPLAAQQNGQSVNGQLVVSICTKGDFRPQHAAKGMKALAETAHRYGFPITWIIKPFTAREASADLQEWHKKFGDEVAWFSEGTPFGGAEAELSELRAAVPRQKITSTGNTKYGEPWVRLYEKSGIESVWGRCYEQTDADHICDRGSPHGFYYLRPDCYKAPNTAPGGVVSVPWLSNDPNLIFRCGFQSTFTFDPDDALSMGAIAPGHCEYWFALVDELQKQTRYNKFVPLIIQQEYPSPGLEKTLSVLDELFAYLKKKGIAVVGQAEAVRRYKAAYPDRTPPTYGVFDSLGQMDAIKKPLPIGRFKLEATTERLTKAFMGASFNGFYTTEWDKATGKRFYFHPTAKKFNEHGKLFTYYDENGLLLFEENRAAPLRISNYLEIPPNSQGYTALPELSYFYDTEKYIPPAKISPNAQGRDLQIAVEIAAFEPNIAARARMPYGVMIWGDFRKYALPVGAPKGAAIVGDQGLFWPVVLEVGKAAQFAIALKATDAPKAKAAEIVAALAPLSVRGVNYFPRETPWSGMWTKTPDEVWEKDMAAAAKLGCNSVRTFVMFSEAMEKDGLAQRDGTPTPAYLAKIESLLAAAWRHDIRLILCFEFSPQWLAAPDATARWKRAMTAVVEAHRNDGRVLMWDLMNEPESDEKWTDGTRAYLREALTFIKKIDPNHLTTIGITYRTDRLKEVGLPDVLQYHEYGTNRKNATTGLERLLKTINNQRVNQTERPLFIGEFGMSTARDPQHGADPKLAAKLTDAPGTEADQAQVYATVLEGVQRERLAGAMPWCLYDYPINNPNEAHFGLLRADGSEKPAATVLREAYSRWQTGKAKDP